MKELIAKIFELLTELIKLTPKEGNTVNEEEKEPSFSRNERALATAYKEIGVKEMPGSAEHPSIKQYHAFARVDNDPKKAYSESVAWCAAFIAYCLEMVGMGSTNNLMARSYLKWGKSSKADPLPGDIVILWRDKINGPYGHVGFFIKEEGEHIYLLGGNQSDAVNIKKFSRVYLLDIRRSSKEFDLTTEQRARLLKMSTDLLAGKEIELGTKVV